MTTTSAPAGAAATQPSRIATVPVLRTRLGSLPRPAVYPILLALLAPVSMYNGVADQLSLDGVWRSILVAGLLGLLIATLVTALVRDRDRGAVLAAVIIMVLGWGRQPGLLVLPLIVLVFLGIDALLRRRGRLLPWSLVTTLMTLGVSIALGANIIAAAQTVAPWTSPAPITSGLDEGAAASTTATTTDLPDVYVILLDGHARPDTMDELGIPTGPLRAGLDELGMDLVPDARSSYGFTAQVLSSMFNGDHLDRLLERGVVDRTASGGVDTWNAIQRGAMLQRFRDVGYQVVTVSSGFEQVSLRSADRFIDTGQLNLFEFKLLERGLAGALMERVDPELPFDQLRERIRASFQATSDLAAEAHDRPRLIFSHLAAPHGPLVFRADGSPRPSDGLASYENESPYMARVGREAWAHEYGGHLLYTDELALGAVGRIVAQDPDAVVVLFSDHGHQWIRFPYGSLDDEPLAEFGGMEQRTRVLLAARTPGRDDVLPPDVNLVNVLGRILAAYAAQPWADQPDRYFDCTPDAARCEPWAPATT